METVRVLYMLVVGSGEAEPVPLFGIVNGPHVSVIRVGVQGNLALVEARVRLIHAVFGNVSEDGVKLLKLRLG